MENPFEELALLLKEVREKQNELSAKIDHLLTGNGDACELLTREQKAEQLKVSLPTLRNWERNGIINPVRKGRRVYFHKLDKHPKTNTQ